MTCEVCGDPTKEDHSDRPEEDDYFIWVTQDSDDPDMGLGISKFHFCSVECLQLFVPQEVEA